jgi:endoglucanase
MRCLLLLLLGAAVALAAPPLHTAGRFIVDSSGARVKLAAVNWYGAEEKDFVVAGLDIAPLASISHHIRTMGFNAVRLPWSNEMYESNPVVNVARLPANPDLKGLRALDVFDAVIDALAAEGLYVILDNHSSNADWCCSNTDGNGFWYNAQYPESSWIADWKGMSRYAGKAAVIGADLRNEPRGPVWGGGDPLRDWRAAAQRGGNAVLESNPNLLIFVEGINYALDVTGARSAPVRLNVPDRLVYSSHDYPWDHNGVSSYDALKSALDKNWGYLIDSGIPMWVGEFGTCHTSSSCWTSGTSADQGFWFVNFTRYMQERDVDFAYWALNGTQATGTGRTLGAEETYGILKKDWTSVVSRALLSALQAISTPTEAPAIRHGAIVNPATFSPDISVVPGSLATVFGDDLAPVPSVADALPLPTALGGGVLRTSGGIDVPILFASPGQMNVQIPWEANSGTTFTDIVGALASNPEPVHLAPAAPVIFLMRGTQGAVAIANTALVAARPSPELPNARPAHAGEYIVIYCTGLGTVTNQPATGAASPSFPAAQTVSVPVVKVGSAICVPSFSGLTPSAVGLYQVNVEIPVDAPTGDAVPISITVGGFDSNIVTIAIE